MNILLYALAAVLAGVFAIRVPLPDRRDPSRRAFAALGAACRTHDVLLICDEVATGFGRTGTLFASEQCGLRPDLMAIGKGITGGYLAMAATVASDRVFEAFLGPDLSERTLYHGHSYSGNALAAAVAEHDAVVAITAQTGNMQGQLDLVWAKLLPAFQAKALPADAAAHEQLKHTLGNLVAHPTPAKK